MVFAAHYCIIFCAIRQHNRQTQDRQIFPQQSPTQLVDNMHLLRAILILVGICVLTWMPFAFVTLYLIESGQVYGLHSDGMHAYKAVNFLLCLNSAANPIIYTLRVPQFRHGLKALFCCDNLTKKGPLSKRCKMPDVIRNPAADHGNISVISIKMLKP